MKESNRFRQQQHLVRVAEGDRLIANRHIFPHDDHPVVQAVTALYQRGDLHVDRSSETPLHAQHVVISGIHPDASPRCDVPRPVEAVVVSARVFYQLGVAPAIHRREIDHQGSAVSVFRNSRDPESVLRTVRR